MTKRKKRPTFDKLSKSQLNALDLFQKANTNHDEFIKKIGAHGLLANALRNMEKWYYQRGSSCVDIHLKIWVTEANRKLFTVNSINRLLSLLHKNYRDVVLVRFVIVDEDGFLMEEKDD
jgi:hypothetical protein